MSQITQSQDRDEEGFFFFLDMIPQSICRTYRTRKAVLHNTILVQFVETTSWCWYLFTEECQWIFLQMFEQTALLNYCRKMNGTTELRKKHSRTIIFKILHPFQSFLSRESYINSTSKSKLFFIYLFLNICAI